MKQPCVREPGGFLNTERENIFAAVIADVNLFDTNQLPEEPGLTTL